MRKLLLKIELVEHAEQRYETAGDWEIGKDGSINISVSDTGVKNDALLIGLHEAVEAVLCKAHGVTQAEVDKFDIAFNKDHDLSEDEPGEDHAAPYFEQHAAADVVERFVALQLGVPWKVYSERVDGLFKEKE